MLIHCINTCINSVSTSRPLSAGADTVSAGTCMLRRINVLWYSLIHSDTCINAPTVSAHANLSWYMVDTVLTRISSQLHPSRQSHPSRVRPHDVSRNRTWYDTLLIHCWYSTNTYQFRCPNLEAPQVGHLGSPKKRHYLIQTWYNFDTMLIQY